MEKVAFIINPFSAKKNYQPFLDELNKRVDAGREQIDASEDAHADHYGTNRLVVGVG